jgi:hypothetical protein
MNENNQVGGISKPRDVLISNNNKNNKSSKGYLDIAKSRNIKVVTLEQIISTLWRYFGYQHETTEKLRSEQILNDKLDGFKEFKYSYMLIEDVEQKFKPLFKEYISSSSKGGKSLPLEPFMNLNTECGGCPFIKSKEIFDDEKRIRQFRDKRSLSISMICDSEYRSRPKTSNNAHPKQGYCECCLLKFDNFDEVINLMLIFAL